jgi:hypothetical protein
LGLSSSGGGSVVEAAKRYRYYVCLSAQKKGWSTCATKSVREAVLKLQRESIDRREVSAALSVFDPVWEQLAPKEQARVIGLLVERVAYDGKAGTVAITFHPTGIKALAQEQGHEVAA